MTSHDENTNVYFFPQQRHWKHVFFFFFSSDEARQKHVKSFPAVTWHQENEPSVYIFSGNYHEKTAVGAYICLLKIHLFMETRRLIDLSAWCKYAIIFPTLFMPFPQTASYKMTDKKGEAFKSFFSFVFYSPPRVLLMSKWTAISASKWSILNNKYRRCYCSVSLEEPSGGKCQERVLRARARPPAHTRTHKHTHTHARTHARMHTQSPHLLSLSGSGSCNVTEG